MHILRVAALLMFMNTLVFGQALLAPGPVQGADPASPLQPVQANPVDVATLNGDAVPVPSWTTYRFFFVHLANLDTVADQQDAAGKPENASKLRAYEQHAAGLSDTEGAILKQVASDCNQAVSNQDVKIQAAIKAFRDQYPNGQFLTMPPPPELAQLWDERTQIINSYLDQLHLELGDDSFLKLDGYIQTNFQTEVQDVPAPGPKPRVPPTPSSRGGQ